MRFTDRRRVVPFFVFFFANFLFCPERELFFPFFDFFFLKTFLFPFLFPAFFFCLGPLFRRFPARPFFEARLLLVRLRPVERNLYRATDFFRLLFFCTFFLNLYRSWASLRRLWFNLYRRAPPSFFLGFFDFEALLRMTRFNVFLAAVNDSDSHFLHLLRV